MMDQSYLQMIAYIVMGVGHATIVSTYNDMFSCILRKDRRWFRFLLVLPCTLVFMALVDFYVSGRWGFSIKFFGLDFTFPEGAFFYYLALQFVIQVVCILFGIISYLWKVIRRKSKFSLAWIGLDFLFAAIYIICFVCTAQFDTLLPLSKEMDPFYAVFAAVLFIAIWLGLHTAKPAAAKRAASQSVKGSPTNQEQMANKSTPNDVEAQYQKVLDEQTRLQNEGKYSAQIPLLTESINLPVDGPKKATLWLFLGKAYENTGNKKVGMECYKTALTHQADNPWALNNLALLKSESGKHEAARMYMKVAIDELSKRGKNLGMFYANYAYIIGKAGFREEAEEYLAKAAEAGYDNTKIMNIRHRLIKS